MGNYARHLTHPVEKLFPLMPFHFIFFSALSYLLLPGLCSGSSDTYYPALYLAPGYFSKAATLAKQPMLATMRAFTHSKTPSSTSSSSSTSETFITIAPECSVQHDEVLVESFDFDSIQVVPVNGTSLMVALIGLQPMLLQSTAFAVTCLYDGAFNVNATLYQQGTFNYTVTFGSNTTDYGGNGPINYNSRHSHSSNARSFSSTTTGSSSFSACFIPNTICWSVNYGFDSSSGRLILSSPLLTSNVTATSRYEYHRSDSGEGEGGFSLDPYMEYYFETTVAQHIENELIDKVLSYYSNSNPSSTSSLSADTSVFVSSWFDAVVGAASVAEFVCQTGTLSSSTSTSPPRSLSSSSSPPSTITSTAETDSFASAVVALWMQPGCGPNAAVTPTLDQLVDHDLLLLLPATDSTSRSRNVKVPFFLPSMKKERVRYLGNRNFDNKWLETVSVSLRRHQKRKKESSSSSSSSCSSVPDCWFNTTGTHHVYLVLSNCTVCYPNDGEYVELLAIVTPSLVVDRDMDNSTTPTP